MAVARGLWGYIERRDQRLMRRMNRWRAPRWIRIWMIAATRLGDGWIWYGLGIMLFASAPRAKQKCPFPRVQQIRLGVHDVVRAVEQEPEGEEHKE